MDEQNGERRQEIARRVEYWRRRRGLTRQVFADRMGRSLSWARKISNGDRQLDRLSVLEQIAGVLDVALAVLIEAEEAERVAQCPDAAEVAALAAALQRYDGILADGSLMGSPNLNRLRRRVRYGWSSFQASDYAALGRTLPDLLVSLQQAERVCSGVERDQAIELLIQTYQLAAEAGFKLSRADLGWLASDRALILAERFGDLALIGASARRVAHALMATGSAPRAIVLVQSTVARLSPGLGDASPAYLSAYGMLFLKGSIAAARSNKAALARDLHSEARQVAVRLGPNPNVQWSNFGTANVAVHRVSALADLHEGGRVVEAASQIDPVELNTLARERRANHFLDIARGYAQWGKREQAVSVLLDADQLAPQEIRCRPAARQLITELVHSYPRGTSPSVPFQRLARAAGVPA
jgi:transcriptional regulator with XRE-family HTH domain